MIITIWRHGEAGSAPSDEQRELTAAGTDDVGYGCHQFHDICHGRSLPHPDLILHSRWTRTTQTAEILATAFTHAGMRPLEALIPGSDVRSVDKALTGLQHASGAPEHIVLVSHQPLVSRLVDHYLGEAGRVPPLSPGALATLLLHVPGRGCGQLLFWALPPDYEAGV